MAKFDYARSIRLRYRGWIISQSVSFNIYPFTRLHLLKYSLSRLLSSSQLNTPTSILHKIAIHLNILWQKFIEFIPTSETIWGINHRKSTKSCVFQYNQKRAPEWRWMTLTVSYKKRIVSLTISYSGCISHIPGYQVVKYDFAGVLVSRHIWLQPSRSGLNSVNAFCLGVVTSQ